MAMTRLKIIHRHYAYAAYVALAVYFASTGNSYPANIFISENETINLNGEIIDGDFETFERLVSENKVRKISLSSPGGKLIEGLKMGEIIHGGNFDTVVPRTAMCASACALMWAAGKNKYIDKEAKIGFHSASVRTQSGPQVSQEGNKFITSYLLSVGLPIYTAIYATRAAPNDMQWLQPSDGKRIGLHFQYVDEKDNVIRLGGSKLILTLNEWRSALLQPGTTTRLYQQESPEAFKSFVALTYRRYQETEDPLLAFDLQDEDFWNWKFSKIKHFNDDVILEIAKQNYETAKYALSNNVRLCSNNVKFLYSNYLRRAVQDQEKIGGLFYKGLTQMKKRPPVKIEDLSCLKKYAESSMMKTLGEYPNHVNSLLVKYKTAEKIDAAINNPVTIEELTIACALVVNFYEAIKDKVCLANFTRASFQMIKYDGIKIKPQ